MENTQPQSQLEPQSSAEEKIDFKRFVMDLFETIGLALILFFAINAVSARVRVDGFSMMPTLHDSEFVLVNKLAYRTGSPTRGDIIVFRSVSTPDLDLIKRVIGLPGDKVLIRGGRVIVNGQTLDEPYIAAAPNYDGEWLVPSGYLFVLGDNRNDSSDSHVWGYLPIQNVIGKALLIYWPPPMWNVLDHPEVLAAQ